MGRVVRMEALLPVRKDNGGFEHLPNIIVAKGFLFVSV